MRTPTASERIYQQWLHTDDEQEQSDLFGSLKAICIKACRDAYLSPPIEIEMSDSGRSVRTGGYRGLAPWVESWLASALDDKSKQGDGARYIGNRCRLALLDEIRRKTRRREGKAIRKRRISGEEEEDARRIRDGMAKMFDRLGLPHKLPISKDRDLFDLLNSAYPRRLSNVFIAHEQGVSEGAIRKRRKRVSRLCRELAGDDHQAKTGLKSIGL